MTSNSELLLGRLYRWERELKDRIFLTQPLGGGSIRTYTFGQAMDEARRMATYLRSLGFAPGSSIAILSHPFAQRFQSALYRQVRWLGVSGGRSTERTPLCLLSAQSQDQLSRVGFASHQAPTADRRAASRRRGTGDHHLYLWEYRQAKGSDPLFPCDVR